MALKKRTGLVPAFTITLTIVQDWMRRMATIPSLLVLRYQPRFFDPTRSAIALLRSSEEDGAVSLPYSSSVFACQLRA
jgi:hypothetical protein